MLFFAHHSICHKCRRRMQNIHGYTQRTIPEYTMDNECWSRQTMGNTWRVILQSHLKFSSHITDISALLERRLAWSRELFTGYRRRPVWLYTSFYAFHIQKMVPVLDIILQIRRSGHLKSRKDQGVNVICALKGRRDAAEAKERLQLEQLDVRHKNS